MDATRRGENCSAKMEIVLIFEIQLLVFVVVVGGVFLELLLPAWRQVICGAKQFAAP